jgi:hypothetical protein
LCFPARQDVDDTLSIRRLKKGVIEVGVHIADVSHFVRPGSLTDIEARKRFVPAYACRQASVHFSQYCITLIFVFKEKKIITAMRCCRSEFVK